MKKLVASASLLTLGLMSGQTAQAQQDSKPWNVSATLRGFYDDNYATAPSRPAFPGGPSRRSSIGFEVSPSVGYNISMDTTSATFKYTYGLKYFEDRANNSADHSHQADLTFGHNFSERYRLTASDSFVVAQEPGLIDPGVVTNPLRTEGNNVRNTGRVEFSAQLSDQFSAVGEYTNTSYDYEQEGDGTRSPLLDRMEHLIALSLRWNVLEQTTVFGTYQYGITDQTSKDFLDVARTVQPNVRDNTSHFFLIGADHNFNSQLSASARGGVRYIEYPNALPTMTQDTLSPYVDIQATYRFLQDSYATLGIRHDHNQTDVGFGVGGPTPTLDAETTTVYGALNHKITPLLTGNLRVQYQNSEFNGGTADGLSDNLFSASLMLSYEINKWLSAETGYSYDRLDSDLGGRSYYRNQVFIGIRAAY